MYVVALEFSVPFKLYFTYMDSLGEVSLCLYLLPEGTYTVLNIKTLIRFNNNAIWKFQKFKDKNLLNEHLKSHKRRHFFICGRCGKVRISN